MPEITTTFTKGRMNLDLDGKLLPNGEYRGALNIQVSTSDVDSVGSVSPIQGNEKLTTGNAQNWDSSYECIGSIADEKNNTAYWFIVKDDNAQSAILRCFKNSVGSLEIGFLLSDSNNSVLEFNINNYITGISVVDNFLYFTDGITEPKVINITQFLNNTTASLSSTSNLYINGEDKGTVTKNDITVIKPRPLNRLTVNLVEGSQRAGIKNILGSYDFSNTNPSDTITIPIPLEEFLVLAPHETYDSDGDGVAEDYYLLGINSDGEFEANYSGVGATNTVAAANQGAAGGGVTYYDAYDPGIDLDDILLLSDPNAVGNLPSNSQVRLLVTGLNVNPAAPTLSIIDGVSRNTPLFAEVTCEVINISNTIPNTPISFEFMKEELEELVFTKDFPRFSYRYKYSDNQYSPFAPFTQSVFLPSRFNIHPTREPYNTGMENNIKKIILKDFVHQNTPKDVVEIDLLYKSDNSTTVYSLDTIKPKKANGTSDNQKWHAINSNNATTFTFPDGSASSTSNTSSGYYEISKELIYAAIPENQLLRIYDNVPKKAKAQDFTAGRIIYGNYTQNIHVNDYDNNLKLNIEDRKFGDDSPNFEDGGLASVKSQRTYQVGMSLLDYQGRETPIFTSGDNGSLKIPFGSGTASNFTGNASRSTRLTVTNIPNIYSYTNVTIDGGDPTYEPYYFKLYVKETSSEYHNLVLDRVYKSKEDGNLWLSFPSSERNKLKEDDFIILKKALDTNTQIDLENKFKVIAIENEAPDFIRYKYRTLGQSDLTDTLYPDSALQPAPEQRKLVLHKPTLVNDRVVGLQQLFNKGESLSIVFQLPSIAGSFATTSERYNISNLEITGDEYIITLDQVIKDSDGWIESSDGVLQPALKTIFFKREEEAWQEFQGRFFVKIISNMTTGQYLEAQIGANITQMMVARKTIFSLRDSGCFDSEQLSASGHNLLIYHQTSSNTGHTASSAISDWTGDILKFKTNEIQQNWFIDELYYTSNQPVVKSDITTNTSFWDTTYFNASGVDDFLVYDVSTSGNLRAAGFNPGFGAASWLTGGVFYFSNCEVSVGASGNDNQRSSLGSPIDGMEGITTTHIMHENATTGTNLLNWKKQLEPSSYTGSGLFYNNRDVYGSSSSKFFMHLSYSGVGVDLHDGQGLNADTGGFSPRVKAGANSSWYIGSIINNPNQRSTVKIDLQSIVNYNTQMDAGYSGAPLNPDYARGKVLPQPQSNTANNTAITNQWNPVGHPDLGNYSASNESIVNNLVIGNKFRFSNDTNEAIFTIVNVSELRIYNHTSWNLTTIVNTSGKYSENQNTVARYYNQWYVSLFDGSPSTTVSANWGLVETAVKNFGAAHNRRVCYAIELDKDPRIECSTNPETLTFDGSTTDSCFIEFVEADFSDGINKVSENPAIFETEPKENIDLDIYYEASPAYPLKLDTNSIETSSSAASPDNKKGYLAAQVGSRVKCSLSDANIYLDSDNVLNGESLDCRVKSWDGDIVELSGGLHALSMSFGGYQYDDGTGNLVDGEYDNINHQDQFFQDRYLTFYDENDGYIMFQIVSVEEIGYYSTATGGGYYDVNKFKLKPKPTKVALSYFNCFSFGNGVESNRIRDDFNNIFIKNGARVSTTLQDQYKQDTRTSGLIFSGIYNKNTSLNDLNQFIQAENITKDLDTTYGSIQKLFARNSDLIALCEDKIVQIFADKDLIFNADGNPQLTASNKVLGQSRPFVGEYGISKNPESFASSSYRAYFTDKQRGAVLRLSMDGLTPISDAGMKDWFRDKLKNDYYRIVGSYDKAKNDYNLTFDSGSGFGYVENDFGNSNNTYKDVDQSITVTYKENVKGWSSFKGFIQEAGFVINSEYVTLRGGKAFHHNDNVGACHFYNSNNSNTRIATVNAILNNDPLSIKNFNTLNYVGDFKGENSIVPAWTCNRLETERGEGRILSTSFNANSIIDSPNIDQFVKKEEKAFAYIQHMHGETDGTIDTGSGSNLGIGVSFENETL